MTARDDRDVVLRRLRRSRPWSPFLRASTVALVLIAVAAWATGGFSIADTFSERRMQNLDRFLGEVTPYPLQGEPFDLGVLLAWAGELLADNGLAALLTTLAISIVAIVLAALGACIAAPLAARTLTTAEPFLPAARPVSAAVILLWSGLSAATRLALVFLRAIPEFVWAFLLLAMLGQNAWPAILALAIHNTGILGRLGGEIVENTPPRPAAALRGLGASRAQIVTASLVPAGLGRALSFFFYRWETCVREATVLGLLGIVSLGYWVLEARAANRYDEMLFYVLLGAVLVGAGDLVSYRVRHWIRR